MIIIINKTIGISAAPINPGDRQGIAAALHTHWPTGLPKSTGGTGGRKTPVIDTDHPADTLKNWI
tara:strand:+ start:310 stop:504 length:195 start_codon:yes stop_codon:yes gene_type:complete